MLAALPLFVIELRTSEILIPNLKIAVKLQGICSVQLLLNWQPLLEVHGLVFSPFRLSSLFYILTSYGF